MYLRVTVLLFFRKVHKYPNEEDKRLKQMHTTVRRNRFVLGSPALIAITLILGVTQAKAQTKAYLANGASNLVTVLDTSNDAVLSTIPVGAGPSRTAVSKDGLRAYVSNTSDNTVSVIDTTTDSVTATI